jgi:hypothetical protein
LGRFERFATKCCNSAVRRLAICAGLLAALALIASAVATIPWAPLYRPLHLPVVEPGGACPVSAVGAFNFRKFGVNAGIGPGPAYPVGFLQPGSILYVEFPLRAGPLAGLEWSGEKVLWFVAPRYRGRLLIRGGRLDGPDLVRFQWGVMPSTELRIQRGDFRTRAIGVRLVGQRMLPSITRVRAPGCYAYQIDGSSFSRVIVFSVVAGPRPRN